MRQQFGDEAEPFLGAVRGGGQAQIDQSQLWRTRHIAQQADGLGAVLGEMNVEFITQNEPQ